MPYRLLADAMLLLHLAIVAFNVLGLILIWVGRWRGWGWIRHPGFRWPHLLVVAFVALLPCLGQICPLTVWEWELRRLAGSAAPAPPGLIERLVQAVLYYDLPPAAFLVGYGIFFLLVLGTWFRIPPKRPPGPT